MYMKKNQKRILAVLGAVVILLALLGSFFYPHESLSEREFRYETEELLPYRAEIVTEDGKSYYEKTYLFYEDDASEVLPRESFRAEGVLWQFLRVDEEPEMKQTEKEYEHKVTFESASKDMKVLLGMLPVTKDITTEDGYQGKVYLDFASVEAKAKGYQSKTVCLKEKRSYYNLDSQDLTYVPKSITEDGEVYQLKDVSWQSINTADVDGYQIPDRFTAVAEYEANVKRSYATGYEVTASYTGMVTKDIVEAVKYTVVFEKSNGLFGHTAIRIIAGVLFAGLLTAAVGFGIKQLNGYRASKKTIEEGW